MEKYVGVKPSDRKPSPKRESDHNTLVQTWDEYSKAKPSFMFQSSTVRKGNGREVSLPGPQDYAISTSHLDRKDFSRPLI